MHSRTYTSHHYEWDPEKAAANQRKHGVDFAEAVGILEDVLGITIRDPDSEEEDRFIGIGLDRCARVLVVIFTLRGEQVRVISARRASSWERRQYEET